MPKLTYKYDWKKIKENALSKHQIDTGIGSVKDAVLKVFKENQLKSPYQKYEEMKKKEIEETALHASRGMQLQKQGVNVLEIDVAGSGFSQPQARHAGLGGKNNIREGVGRAKIDEIGKEKKWKVHWWNRKAWLQKLPKILRPYSEQEIVEHNQIVDKYKTLVLTGVGGNGLKTKAEELFEKKYGKNATAKGLEGKKYIYVKESAPEIGEDGVATQRTRYSMPGPLGTIAGMAKGSRNSGEYSIKNLGDYILAAGQDYLTKKFEEWKKIEGDAQEVLRGTDHPDMDMKERFARADEIRKKVKPVSIMLKGHSRGGVAVSHGAMQLKYWIHENYPQYEKYVNFDMIQMDPVAGYGSDHGAKRNINLVEETRPKIKEELEERKMRPLGSSANTTVVYSLHTDHSHFFSPQVVDGAKRIILTTTKHSVNLDTIDESAKEYDNNKAHRQGYMDLENGEVYRNSGLSELPEGVYIADENNRLIKIPSVEVGRKIIGEVLSKASGQEGRHRRIDEVMDHWFKAHPMEKTKDHEAARERTSVKELEANEKKGDLKRRNSYSASEHWMGLDSPLEQEPERKRGMSVRR